MTSPSCALLAVWLAGSDRCRQGCLRVTAGQGPPAVCTAHPPCSLPLGARLGSLLWSGQSGEDRPWTWGPAVGVSWGHPAGGKTTRG